MECTSGLDDEIWVFLFSFPLFPGPAVCPHHDLLLCPWHRVMRSTDHGLDWNTLNCEPEQSSLSFAAHHRHLLTTTSTKALTQLEDQKLRLCNLCLRHQIGGNWLAKDPQSWKRKLGSGQRFKTL